jgi:ribosomal protein S18 acetylase RimI-like enzyme
MISIRKATLADAMLISTLANEIWWDTYKDVLSDDQISFMLSKMYNVASLEEQMNQQITFLILTYNDVETGFAAYAKADIDKIYKLEKLYLQKQDQGKGLGKVLISKVEEEVKTLGAANLYLNVNRNNKAFHFYKKLGYIVVEEVDIPYYDFVLNDYIMMKSLN